MKGRPSQYADRARRVTIRYDATKAAWTFKVQAGNFGILYESPMGFASADRCARYVTRKFPGIEVVLIEDAA